MKRYIKYLFLPTLCALIGLAGGASISLSTPSYYTASSALLVSSITATKSSSATRYAALNSSQYLAQRAASYAGWSSTSAFRESVLLGTGRATTAKYPQFSVVVDTDSSLLLVNATDSSASDALQTVKFIDNQLVLTSSALDGRSSLTPQIRVDVLSEPRLPASPTGPSRVNFLLLGGLGGLAIGGVASYAIFRRTRASGLAVHSAAD